MAPRGRSAAAIARHARPCAIATGAASSRGPVAAARSAGAAPSRPLHHVQLHGQSGAAGTAGAGAGVVVGGVEPAEAAVDDAVAGHRPSAADVGAHFDPDPVLVHRPPSPVLRGAQAWKGRWRECVADRGPPDDSRADRGAGHARTAMRAPSRPATASTPATASSDTARVAPWARKPIRAGPASTPA